MRAFEVHAVDYLLKPIGRERFEAALERAKSRLGEKTAARARTRRRCPAAATISRTPRGERRHQGYADPSCQARLRGSPGRLRSAGQPGQEASQQQTIAGLEASLNPDCFVRIHRSYVVNLERVVRIEPTARTAAWPFSPTALACPSAAPATPAQSPPRRTQITSCLSFRGGVCPRNLLFLAFCEKQLQSDAVMKTEAQKIVASHVSRAEIAGRRTAVPFRPATEGAALRAEHPDWTDEAIRQAVRDIFLYARANLKRFGS